MPNPLELLHQLADVHGVQTSFHNDRGDYYQASPEALIAVLQALGAPLQRLDDAGEALRQHWHGYWRRLTEPVCVVWDGRHGEVLLRLPAQAKGTISARL